MLSFHVAELPHSTVYALSQLPELVLNKLVNAVLSQNEELAETVVYVLSQLAEFVLYDAVKFDMLCTLSFHVAELLQSMLYVLSQLPEFVFNKLVSAVLSQNEELIETVVYAEFHPDEFS